jgi:hypothetical protein
MAHHRVTWSSWQSERTVGRFIPSVHLSQLAEAGLEDADRGDAGNMPIGVHIVLTPGCPNPLPNLH